MAADSFVCFSCNKKVDSSEIIDFKKLCTDCLTKNLTMEISTRRRRLAIFIHKYADRINSDEERTRNFLKQYIEQRRKKFAIQEIAVAERQREKVCLSTTPTEHVEMLRRVRDQLAEDERMLFSLVLPCDLSHSENIEKVTKQHEPK